RHFSDTSATFSDTQRHFMTLQRHFSDTSVTLQRHFSDTSSNDKLAASERRRAARLSRRRLDRRRRRPRLKLRRPSRFESPLGELAGRGCSYSPLSECFTFCCFCCCFLLLLLLLAYQDRSGCRRRRRRRRGHDERAAELSLLLLLLLLETRACRACCRLFELRILHQRHFFSLLLFLLLIDALRAEGHLGRLFLKLDLLRLLLVLCNSALCTTRRRAADDSPAVPLVSVSSPLATGFSSTMELLRLLLALLELLELPEPLEPPPASLAAFSFSAARLSAVWMASSCSAGIRAQSAPNPNEFELTSRLYPNGGHDDGIIGVQRAALDHHLAALAAGLGGDQLAALPPVQRHLVAPQRSVAARAPHTSVMVLGLLLSSSDTSGPLTEVAWGHSNLVGLVRLVGGAVPGQGLQPDAVHSAGRQPRRLQAAVAGQPHAAVGDAVDQQAVPPSISVRPSASGCQKISTVPSTTCSSFTAGTQLNHFQDSLCDGSCQCAELTMGPGSTRPTASATGSSSTSDSSASSPAPESTTQNRLRDCDGWRLGATAMARMKTMPGLRSFSGSQETILGAGVRSGSGSTSTEPQRPGAPTEATQNMPGRVKVYRKLPRRLARPLLNDWSPFAVLSGACSGVGNFCVGVVAASCSEGVDWLIVLVVVVVVVVIVVAVVVVIVAIRSSKAAHSAVRRVHIDDVVLLELGRVSPVPQHAVALDDGDGGREEAGAGVEPHDGVVLRVADDHGADAALVHWGLLVGAELQEGPAGEIEDASLCEGALHAAARVRPWVVDRSDHRVAAEAGGAHLHLVHPAGGALADVVVQAGPLKPVHEGAGRVRQGAALKAVVQWPALRGHLKDIVQPVGPLPHPPDQVTTAHRELLWFEARLRDGDGVVLNPPPLTLGPGAAMSVDDARLFGALFSLKCWMAAWLGVTIRAPMLAKASCAESSSCWHWPSSQPSPELSDSPPARLQQVWREAICRQLHPVLLRLHLHDDGADVGGRLLVVEVRVVEHPRLQEVVVLLHWNQTRSPAFTTRMAGSKLRSVISTRCSLEFEFNCGGKMRYKLLTELGGRRRYSDCPMVRKLSLSCTCTMHRWYSAGVLPLAMNAELLKAAVHSTVGCLLHEVRHGACSTRGAKPSSSSLAKISFRSPTVTVSGVQRMPALTNLYSPGRRTGVNAARHRPELVAVVHHLRDVMFTCVLENPAWLMLTVATSSDLYKPLRHLSRSLSRLFSGCGRFAISDGPMRPPAFADPPPASDARVGAALALWAAVASDKDLPLAPPPPPAVGAPSPAPGCLASQSSESRSGQRQRQGAFQGLGRGLRQHRRQCPGRRHQLHQAVNDTPSARLSPPVGCLQRQQRDLLHCPWAVELGSDVDCQLKSPTAQNFAGTGQAGAAIECGIAGESMSRISAVQGGEAEISLGSSRSASQNPLIRPAQQLTRDQGGEDASPPPRAVVLSPPGDAAADSGREALLRQERRNSRGAAAWRQGRSGDQFQQLCLAIGPHAPPSSMAAATGLMRPLPSCGASSTSDSCRNVLRPQSQPEDKEEPQPQQPQRQRRQRRSVGWSNEAPGQPPSPSSVSPPPSILKAAPPQQPLPQSALLAAGGDQWQSAAATPDSGCSSCLYICSLALIALTFPFSLIFCLRVVAEYERAVVLRLGRVLGQQGKGPGLFFIIPCCDSVRIVDLRTVTFDVPPQEVLTKDSVTVAVDAVVYYRIFSPVVSVTNVEDADRSTRLLAQTTLRNVLGTKNLSEILSEREEISCMMQECLDLATDPWGVKVERVEIKDVRLPVQLQRAMAAEAEAAREARAKVIMAEGEQKASRALREAAVVIQESPFALQLRYLHTLNVISAEKNSTIIFPLPMEFLAHFRTGQ
uniref:PHB domain-containing protein n=1 Tax=Macrostomum lignano TaxID=282301 RepID=A0A1I8IIL9_9PLAT